MANINKIRLSGQTYDIQDVNASKTVELTQAQYDALVSGGTVDPNTFYIITDAQGGDLSNYYTKSETSGATQISTALASKADTATTYTKTEVDTALASKQTTLTAGTGIDITDNVISATGGGGGGKAVSGGTNISITTGVTADTINCTIPVSADTNNSMGVITNYLGNTAGHLSFAGGYITKAKMTCSFAFGLGAETNNNYSTAIGEYAKTTCWGETAFGHYNNSVSANTNFDGNSGNTLFSVGNGTADNARHNAFEVRQNGDIYLSLNGQDVKLQDQLGGGGTVDQTIISGSTNAVAGGAVYNKIDEVEQVTARALNELNEEVSEKQDTLVSGTNIKTINNESILGSGNIDIQGGGKAVSGGTNISITTGETADTVSCTLPLTITGNDNTSLIRTNQGGTVSQKRSFAYGTNLTISSYDYSNSAAFGTDNSIGGPASFVCGRNNTISNLGGFGFACGDHNTIGYYSTGGHIEGGYNNIDGGANYAHSEGYHTRASQSYSHTEGLYTNAKNQSEHSSGQYNNSVSASTTFGDSGNTLFSVGNGTADNARHNAFEVRQNGDIYITLNDQDVKLQDQLGGSSITVDQTIISGSTNAVAGGAVYNKIDEVEEVTAASLNALNDNFGGLKLVKLTQAEYNALATKDSSTLYVIVG